MSARKELPLEALRGFAAIAVVLGHIVIAFTPYLLPIRRTPFNFAINGSAAVVLFFVLSGYVLTRRYFQSHDDMSIARGMLKRWPRLMGPVLLAVLCSWALFTLDAYFHEGAGLLSGSGWLQSFGGAPGYPFDHRLRRALGQGAVLVFVRESASGFDPVLWTMKFEFIGSFISFGFAFLLDKLRGAGWLASALACATVLGTCYYSNGFLFAFPAGVILARCLPRDFNMRAWIAIPVAILACYLLGYAELTEGAYAPFKLHRVGFVNVSIVGSLLAIAVVTGWSALRRLLSGPAMSYTGELSFPLYLVHIPVICSVGSEIFLLTRSLAATAATVLAGSFAAAIPFMWFNRYWVARVNRAADWLMVKGPASSSPLH
jgi:peptidoglycan/LPS O-acetylase OafA/YrhL